MTTTNAAPGDWVTLSDGNRAQVTASTTKSGERVLKVLLPEGTQPLYRPEGSIEPFTGRAFGIAIEGRGGISIVSVDETQENS